PLQRAADDLGARDFPRADGFGELDGGERLEIHGAYFPSLSSTRMKSPGSASSGSVSPTFSAVSDSASTNGRMTSSRSCGSVCPSRLFGSLGDRVPFSAMAMSSVLQPAIPVWWP